jgi:hypothetical protein
MTVLSEDLRLRRPRKAKGERKEDCLNFFSYLKPQATGLKPGYFHAVVKTLVWPCLEEKMAHSRIGHRLVPTAIPGWALTNCVWPFALGRLSVGCPIGDLINHFFDQIRFSYPDLAVSPGYGHRR